MRTLSGFRWLSAAAVLTLFVAADLAAQGVTTAAISGRVTADEGSPLSGAQIIIVHQPTGVQKGTLTREDGRFFVPGLRPGGPYRVQVQMIGYGEEVVEELRLGLGQTEEVNFVLGSEAVELEEIRVIAERAGRRTTGVSTVVNEEAIETAPTIGRNLADYVRLTPQAYVENDDDDGPAISVAGQNNRYNSIYIDGAVNNDVFGLSAQGTNGGQTGATPISLDAIEEFQIEISPFDVTQAGFTGAAINAITRSGTNQLEGSAYWHYRNQAFAGLTPTEDSDTELRRLPDFTTWRGGFRLGGPIIENELFFFVNGEMLRSRTPQPFDETYRGDWAGRLDELRDFVIQETGYDPGAFGDKEATLDDNKLLAKLDWNLSADHRLTARHSYSRSENVDAFRSGAFTINYANNSEVFPNTTNSTAVELNSTFGNQFANKLILGATFVHDDRGVAGEPFPTITITDGDGEIRLGPEPFSTANLLTQDIFTLTDNFNWFVGRHTLTLGANLEYYSIANLFIPFNHGWYFFFGGVEDFQEAVRTGDAPFATGVLRGYSLVGDRSKIGDESDNIGVFDAFQAGFYLQDDYEVSDRLNITAGLRIDVPKITTEPRRAPDVFDTTVPAIQQHYDLEGARPGATPAAQVYFQPRFGFRYDATEDGSTRLRGGAGLFTGRVPFVWPGGMFLNNGANTGIVSQFFSGGIPFRADPRNGVTVEDFGASDPIPSGRLEMFEEDFRYPTVFRTALGIDAELPNEVLVTLEGQYTKTLNNILVTNVNLNPACLRELSGPDSRTVYACSVDDGRIDIRANQIDPRYTNIHRVGTTSEGYTYDVTARLQKQFGDRLFTSIGYTLGDAYDVNPGTSSQINSLWQYPTNVNGNNFLELARSDFSIGQRIVGQLRWREEFLENLGTTVSLIYTGEAGRPFSYLIGDSENMMGQPDADDAALLYVPNDASELTFEPITDRDGNVLMSAAQQAQEFEEFISGNEYLNSRRGMYAERNGDRTPWENVIDLRISQEFFANLGGRRHQAEITLDIFNFTNLLSDAWGRRYIGIFTYPALQFRGFEDDLTPVYQFRRDEIDGYQDVFDGLIHDFGTYSSRWHMQLGVRYTM